MTRLCLLMILVLSSTAHAAPPGEPSFTPERVELMRAQMLPGALQLAGTLDVNRRCPIVDHLPALALELKLIDSLHKLRQAGLKPEGELPEAFKQAGAVPCAQAMAMRPQATQTGTVALFEWTLVAHRWAALSPRLVALTPAEQTGFDNLLGGAKVQLARLPGFDLAAVEPQAHALADMVVDLRRSWEARQSGAQPELPPSVVAWLVDLEVGLRRLVDGVRIHTDQHPELAIRPSLDTAWVAYGDRGGAVPAWRMSQDIGCKGGLAFTGDRNCSARVVVTGSNGVWYLRSGDAKGGLTPPISAVSMELARGALTDRELWAVPGDGAWADAFERTTKAAPPTVLNATNAPTPPSPGALSQGVYTAWKFPDGTAEQLRGLPTGSVVRITATFSDDERVPRRAMHFTTHGLEEASAWSDAFAAAVAASTPHP
jgi:hypothetical protein